MFIFHKLSMHITEGFRTFKRQQALYDIGRNKAGGRTVTNARPGESFHQYGCALDVCFAGPDAYLEEDDKGDFFWKEFGRFSKAHGFVWGGDFTYILDKPHVQLTYGLTLPEIQTLYKGGGPSAIWGEFDKIRDIEVASEWTGSHTRVKILNPEGGENGNS